MKNKISGKGTGKVFLKKHSFYKYFTNQTFRKNLFAINHLCRLFRRYCGLRNRHRNIVYQLIGI